MSRPVTHKGSMWKQKVRRDNSSHFEMFDKACVRCLPARLGVLVDTWMIVSSAYIWQLRTAMVQAQILVVHPCCLQTYETLPH